MSALSANVFIGIHRQWPCWSDWNINAFWSVTHVRVFEWWATAFSNVERTFCVGCSVTYFGTCHSRNRWNLNQSCIFDTIFIFRRKILCMCFRRSWCMCIGVTSPTPLNYWKLRSRAVWILITDHLSMLSQLQSQHNTSFDLDPRIIFIKASVNNCFSCWWMWRPWNDSRVMEQNHLTHRFALWFAIDSSRTFDCSHAVRYGLGILLMRVNCFTARNICTWSLGSNDMLGSRPWIQLVPHRKRHQANRCSCPLSWSYCFRLSARLRP